MANVAVTLTADMAGLTRGFAQAEQQAQGFKNRLTAVGKATAQAFDLTRFRGFADTASRELSNLAGIASASAAILSKFASGNKELQEKLEGLTVTMAIAGPAIRGFGYALRLATGPIGLVVTAIAGLILVTQHWETVSTAVVNTAARVWATLADFFTKLWTGIGEGARGLGQILLGALTLDTARIQAGYAQMMAGFASVRDTMVSAASGIAAGIGSVVGKLGEMVSGIGAANTAAKETLGLASQIQDKFREGELFIAENIRLVQEQIAAEREAALVAHDNAVAFAETQSMQDEAMRASLLLREESNRMAEAEILAINSVAQARLTASEADKAIHQQTVQNTAELGAAILGLFGQHKAAAIVNALINTYEGVTLALAKYPPPLSFIMAAKTLAFGIAQVMAIKSAALAEGGIVTGPTRALIGEAGPEAVIPLDRFRFGVGDLNLLVMLDERTLMKAIMPLVPGYVHVRAGLRTV